MYQSESPETTGNSPDALKLWRHLFGGERGLLWVWTGVRDEHGKIPKATIKENAFAYPKAAKAAAEWANEKAQEGREVFFCAHLLTKPRRIKENAAEVRALWADLDASPLPNGALRPTAIWQSSPGKFHCGWRLSDPIPPAAAETLNRRLARAINADPSGFDLSQLLRVPGTLNNKYPECPIVHLTELDGAREYTPGDLDRTLPVALEQETDEAEYVDEDEPPVRLGEAALGRWRGEVLEHKEDGSVDRSRSLSQIAWALARAGATERTITQAIENRDVALGFEKYAKRRDSGKAYRDLARTVTKKVEPPEDDAQSAAYDTFTPIHHLRHSLRKLPAPATFPVDALPDGCRQLVKEGSKTIGCPPDFLAAPILAALGSAIGLSHVIEVLEGWTEAPNLWIATVGHPGSRKTPPAREAKRPVAGYQARLRQEYRAELKRYEAEPEEHDDPPQKRTAYVDDITTESLIVSLDESPRGVIQFKDELLGLIRGLDQYKGGRGSDRQFYLSGWSGEPYAYRRKGSQEDVLLPRPFLSVVGSIQTDLLHEIADGREDGLADRFLYVYPERVRSRLSEDKRISEDARRSYAALYMRLRELRFQGFDEYGHPEPKLVKPTPKAKELLHDLINSLRDEAELPGFPQRLTWLWPKLESNLARLTLILAMCRYVNLLASETPSPVRLQVRNEDVKRASQILDYFKSHLRRVYGLLYKTNPRDAIVEDVARFLLACGGSWAGGTATDFHLELPSERKPKRPDDLAKVIKDRSERVGDIAYRTKHARVTKEDGEVTTRRVLQIDLLT